MTPYLLTLAVLLGIAPGLIAHGKGRNFFLWWLYGIVLGPVALLHAILLRHRHASAPFAVPRRQPQKRWRSHWPAVLWAATSVAIAIVAVTGYVLLAPDQFGLPKGLPEIARSADRTPPAQSVTAPKPASDEAAPPEALPRVRVTLRREGADRGDNPDRAPVAPVERLTAGGTTTERSLERTVPNEPDKPEPGPVVARSTPAQPVVPPPPAPPPAPTKSDAAPPAAPPATPSAATPSRPARPQAEPAQAEPTQPQAEPTQREPAQAKPTQPAAAPEPPPTDVTAVGETVLIVQQALAERGYNPGPANGRAGRQTQDAIRKFQSDRGLDPTGAIDYALLENLDIVGPRVHAFRPPPGMTVGR